MIRRKSKTPRARRPRWDGERCELWLGNVLVKRFRRPAPNQEAILAAFEELGWPRGSTTPLRGRRGARANCAYTRRSRA